MKNFLVRDVTLSRAVAGSVDRYGNATSSFGSDVEVVKGWVAQQSRSENVDGREAQVDGYVLYLAAGADVTGVDRVSVDGQVFEVVGPPNRAWSPRGEHHLELTLRVVEG